MHFLSLFRRRGFTRSDRPNRLVSDYDTFHVGKCQTLKPFSNWPFTTSFARAGFAFRETFTHAHDCSQTGCDGGFRLFVYRLISFAVELAALGMSDDHIRTTRHRLTSNRATSPVWAPNSFCAAQSCAADTDVRTFEPVR